MSKLGKVLKKKSNQMDGGLKNMFRNVLAENVSSQHVTVILPSCGKHKPCKSMPQYTLPYQTLPLLVPHGFHCIYNTT